MKIIRFLNNNTICCGLVKDNIVYELSSNDIFSNTFNTINKTYNFKDVKILPPCQPGKIIALAFNYKDLIGNKDKYEEPIIFFKPTSAIIGPGESIILNDNRKTWIEVELAIVIKKKCKNVSLNQAKHYILGYTIANDVTTQNILGRDHHLARSKGLDTFCPVGPIIETDIDTSNLVLSSSINGSIKQKSSTNKRILSDIEAVSFLSGFFTLEPGDLILTGTPANAEQSIISDGDAVELYIEGIGTLSNTVKGAEHNETNYCYTS
jgi:2-keto-4-pentenoate hydratase/2-oxohepta-3-ene-1,7-dioic acid hydratase in catechol pathway